MSSKLEKFLFHDSQQPSIDDLLEGLAGVEDLEAKSAPLESALKDAMSGMEIPAFDFTNSLDSTQLVAKIRDAEEYQTAIEVLGHPETVSALGALGWVARPAGEVSMSGEPQRFEIHFMSIGEIEPENDNDTLGPKDIEAIVKASLDSVPVVPAVVKEATEGEDAAAPYGQATFDTSLSDGDDEALDPET